MELNSSVETRMYEQRYQRGWNDFVDASKNGNFLFNRNYMEYHADRFHDSSLMFFRKGKLVGLFPANFHDNTLFSHEGLTFGGFILPYNNSTISTLEMFSSLITYCKDEKIKTVIYKAIPYIYHSIPANEDLYALFRLKASLTARNVSSCICLPNSKEFNESRRCNIRKALRNNLQVKKSDDLSSFMEIVSEALMERHKTKPVHSIDEIKLLKSRFPENIKLFGSFKNGVMVAGVLIYESKNVAHEQYAVNSKEGLRLGAQDIIEDYLINDYYKEKRFFDFGISTERQGQVLNKGLIARKEGFTASSVMYDIYQVNIHE